MEATSTLYGAIEVHFQLVYQIIIITPSLQLVYQIIIITPSLHTLSVTAGVGVSRHGREVRSR